MGTHPIFESDFDCLTDGVMGIIEFEDKSEQDAQAIVAKHFDFSMPVRAGFMILPTGMMVYVMRNRGTFLKYIFPPIFGVIAGQSITVASHLSMVKQGIQSGEFQRVVPESFVKESYMIMLS